MLSKLLHSVFRECQTVQRLTTRCKFPCNGSLYRFSTVNKDDKSFQENGEIDNDSSSGVKGSSKQFYKGGLEKSLKTDLGNTIHGSETDTNNLSANDLKREDTHNMHFNRKERVKACLAKLKKGPHGKYINVFEVATEVDMLIASFLNLRDEENPNYKEGDSDEDVSLEDIDVEKFKRLQKRLRNGTYEFKPVILVPPPKIKVKKK
eukprot:c23537_g1_i2 orf=241-858(-)